MRPASAGSSHSYQTSSRNRAGTWEKARSRLTSVAFTVTAWAAIIMSESAQADALGFQSAAKLAIAPGHWLVPRPDGHLKLLHLVGCVRAMGVKGAVLSTLQAWKVQEFSFENQAVALVQKAPAAIEVIPPRYGCRGIGGTVRFGAKAVLL